MGWVRNGEDGGVLVHAEGPEAAVDELVAFLREGPPAAEVAGVEIEPVKVDDHAIAYNELGRGRRRTAVCDQRQHARRAPCRRLRPAAAPVRVRGAEYAACE